MRHRRVRRLVKNSHQPSRGAVHYSACCAGGVLRKGGRTILVHASALCISKVTLEKFNVGGALRKESPARDGFDIGRERFNHAS